MTESLRYTAKLVTAVCAHPVQLVRPVTRGDEDEVVPARRGAAAAPEYERRLYDFQFHMTDWMTELMPFVSAMVQPESPAKQPALSAVYAFLIHAVPHLVGAKEAIDGLVMEHTFPPPIAAPGEHAPAPKRNSTRRRVGAKA